LAIGNFPPLKGGRTEEVKNHLKISVLVACMLAGCTSFLTGPARPVRLDKDTAAKLTREIEKERADNEEWLRTGPTSYLAAIDRIEFNGKKTLAVGSAEDNNLQLSGPGIEPHHLRVTVVGDRFRIECIDANARFKIKEETKREATVDPMYIQLSRFTLRLSHQNFPALIVFDPQSPHFKQYKGMAYFPVDLSYRYELPLRHYAAPESITIMSTRNNERSAEYVGWVDFFVGNTPCRFEVTRLLEPGSGKDELAILFRDASSGKESYALGRYVDLKKLANGNYLLDFNQAYNPACAFSEYYNCPVPPKANTLKEAIRAGEMDPHYH
jgi:uncharacterized protein